MPHARCHVFPTLRIAKLGMLSYLWSKDIIPLVSRNHIIGKVGLKIPVMRVALPSVAFQ